MDYEELTHIICAIRGGPESRDTATHAIDMAIESKARLTFYHVVDAEFLEYATIGPLSIIYKELSEMGKFAMLILKDRAERRGVEEVDYLIRNGDIRQQLIQIARDTEAEILVMGKPTRSPGTNVFKDAEIGDFADTLRREGNMLVETVTPSPSPRSDSQ